MPPQKYFDDSEAYYSVMFHELAHSTGHEKRLNRKHNEERDEYAQEELVAEMAASMLCGEVGIEKKTIERSAAYLDHWLERLKGDKRLIVYAASKAQKAVDYIKNEKKEYD
jgi:antirestriction protein ArdC